MRYVSAISFVVSAIWMAACASAPPPTPSSPPPPTGEYRGTVTLDGARRAASLSVAPDGQGLLRAVLHVDGKTLAVGRADWLDGTLYLGFDYGGENPQCAGRLHLVTQPALAEVKLTGVAPSSAYIALDLSGDALSLTPNALRPPKGTLGLDVGRSGLAGALHARDCTGSARGSVEFGLYSAVH